MKVYLSADIEGINNVTAWDETELNLPDHQQASRLMTDEVLAACRGAIKAGADEILLKDGHDSARNIIIDELPEEVRIMRGWTNTPESMMAAIDSSFDAAIYIGYHAGAGYNGNPLSHTMDLSNNYIKINGRRISEFDMNAYVAAYYGVPSVFISGDEQVCSLAKELVPEIGTCGVKYGIGNATFSIAPSLACKKIEAGVCAALANRDKCLPVTPDHFDMEINFKECVHALRSSFYPGAEQLDERTVLYRGKDIQDMMAARMFML
ncbi:M55 family metallopeptidase [Aminicella lysinilytica]|uniref:M55 family metallopeptidase n=1 Tax=Aminicella lysinilytica TaxID=433323 RepID=UPI0026E941DC|nr:M55 family metallopeptidase [Aminicella lysinilytica]